MRYFYIVVICFLVGNLLAQDPHFSQYNNTGVYLNPALSGIYEGRMRYTLNYHDQWNSVIRSAPYRTVSASAELKNPVANGDFYSLNINTSYDQVGAARFSQGNVQLGGSYIKKLGGGYGTEHYLSAGGQIGFGQNTVNTDGLWYGRQYNVDTGSRNLDSGETQMGQAQTKAYLNGNLGLFYYSVFNESSSLYAGIAAHHFNEPNISLAVSAGAPSVPLDRKFSLNIGGELPLTNSTSILPSAVILSQGPSRQVNIGSTLRFSGLNVDELAVRAGLYLRANNTINSFLSPEAVILLFGLEKERWMANISYDLTVSSLADFNDNRGAFELSFIYVSPFNERRSAVSCPKF